ncbi:MAG: DUF6511 domain-containing protein [Proteobacteria bacterium]|nr:DUF6511 domain-containing protein [Pseudomonadota bacterium]
MSDEIGVCAVCSRQARGFGFCLRLKWSQFAFYKFCSRRCQDIGANLAQRSYGMIDKTAREAQAIRDARKSFAEALTTLGLMAPFFDRPAAEIDQLIEAAVSGYIDSMQTQGARLERDGCLPEDPIPF